MSVPEQNKMGLLSCTSYVIGNIIGSGIFITPAGMAEYSKSIGLSLLLWIFCGLLSLLGAIVYIELGTSIVEPGCDYAYAIHVGWRGAAFSFMVVSVFLTFPASAAIQTVTFGEYIVETLSPLVKLEGFLGAFAPKLVGLVLLILLTVLNFYSLEKFAARFQTIATAVKMVAMVLIIGAGLYHLAIMGETGNFAAPFSGADWSPGALALGMYGGLWSYAGWDILNYGTPEISHPRRTMPLALVIGISVVCLTYLSINVSFFTVLSIDEVRNSTAIAADFAERSLGGAASALPVMIALIVTSTLNSNLFCGSRIMQAAARERQLPAVFAGLHVPSGSPRPAVLAQSLLTVLCTFISMDYLINCVTFVMWAQRALTAAALLLIRYQHIPVESNPIRVPIILTVVLFISSTALVVVPLFTEFFITLVGFGILIAAFIVYVLLLRINWPCNLLQVVDKKSAQLVNRVMGVETDWKEVPAIKPEECQSFSVSRQR